MNPLNSSHNNPISLKVLAYTLFLAVVITGCSTLPQTPPVPEIQPQIKAAQTEGTQTTLAKIIDPLQNQYPDLTGYHILFDPLEALAARLRLIDKAEKNLDLQYYIWDNDKVGALALHAMLRAADRGVQVRLLIDDNSTKKLDGVLSVFSQHPNIQVKFFNPYRFRSARPIDMVLDLKRINRRMHNKSFIVDKEVALIGGRNMSNQYYNVSDNYQFSDVDVMLVGAAVHDITSSFDEYWNFDYAYPVESLVNLDRYTLTFEDLRQQLNDHYHLANVQNFLSLTERSNAFDEWLNKDIRFDWVKAQVVKDSPEKIKSKAHKKEHLSFQLINRLEKPEQSLDLVSAYFIPEKKGAKILTDLAQSGTEVRVLTNSFHATDVPIVHSFYTKYRKRLLESGVQLYEFLPAPEKQDLDKHTSELATKAKVNMKGLSRSSLHAKLMAFDEKQVFIGSFNFDPRSAYLNTEIGVILNSPSLGHAVHSTMDEKLDRYAYKLVLDANQNINWIHQNSQGKTIYKTEPKVKWWQRLSMKLVSMLPIEGFM